MLASRNAMRRVSAAPAAGRTAMCSRRALIVQAKKQPVSESYAKALVELAEEKGKLELVHADVDAIHALLQNNLKLSELMNNPIVESEKKRAVLQKISKEAGFQQVAKDRLPLLDEICSEFEDLYCKMTDTQVATLRSAVKLEQEQQFLIAKKLQELTGSKNIKLKPSIDSSLIAGFVVEYGSSQIDLSVRGQLDKVSEELARNMATQFA